jgi:methyl-accepting chemotaxis protein
MPLLASSARLAVAGLTAATTVAAEISDSLGDGLRGLLGPLLALQRRLAHLIDAPAALASASTELRRIAEAIESVPALRDDMSALPATIDGLEARMTELLAAINELMGSVETLAAATHPLHATTERLEKLGHRLEERGATAGRSPRRWLRGERNAPGAPGAEPATSSS